MSGLSPAPRFAAFDASDASLPAPADDTALLLLLAGIFAAPPTEATIASLRAGAGAALLDRLGGEAGLAAPIAALRGRNDEAMDPAMLARRLGPVFGRLFLGIGGPSTVAPYESFHRCGGRLFQAPVGEMDRLLAAHDLSVGLDREPSDHLSIETAFLAHLVATDHSDRFDLAERLNGWVPAFRDGLASADETGFFAAAAGLLVAAIERGFARSPSRDLSRKA